MTAAPVNVPVPVPVPAFFGILDLMVTISPASHPAFGVWGRHPASTWGAWLDRDRPHSPAGSRASAPGSRARARARWDERGTGL